MAVPSADWHSSESLVLSLGARASQVTLLSSQTALGKWQHGDWLGAHSGKLAISPASSGLPVAFPGVVRPLGELGTDDGCGVLGVDQTEASSTGRLWLDDIFADTEPFRVDTSISWT